MQLRERCAAAGLSTSGSKAALVARLEQHASAGAAAAPVRRKRKTAPAAATAADESPTSTDEEGGRDDGSSTSRSGSRWDSDSDADDDSASSSSDSELQSDAEGSSVGPPAGTCSGDGAAAAAAAPDAEFVRGRTREEHSVPRLWAAVQDAFTLGGARVDTRWTKALLAVTNVIKVAETHEDAERAAYWSAIKTKMVAAWNSGVEAVCELRFR